MGKQSKRNRSKREDPRPAPALRKKDTKEEEEEEETIANLKFQDPFVEEYRVEGEEDDDDEEWEDVEGGEEGGGEGGGGGYEVVQSWNPLSGDPLQSGQKLEMDPSAYKMHHALTPEWPSLSFDFLRDSLGDPRTRFPHTLLLAAGSQADRAENNSLTIMKLSDLAKMQIENEDDILGEELPDKDDDASDDEDSDDEIDLDPVVEHYTISHYGGVNRVRSMPQRPNIIATWSDVGKVNLFNVEAVLQRFAVSEGKPPAAMTDMPKKPFFSYSKHGVEGYAMDWSRVNRGHLVTGDCSGAIHLWTPRSEGGDGSYSVAPAYPANDLMVGNDIPPSVEDLQWSPTEATVFASAECGGYVRIFDTRATGRSMLCRKVHANGSDVNVLSWNGLVGNLLATGSDDGVLSVWDLRNFQSTKDEAPSPLARFTPHKSPISSVEWHPTDESMVAVTDDTGAYVYDLSVEEDDVGGGEANADIPPQLLFVHSGSDQFKEVHWHPQISSCLMATALSGYSVFIPSNL